MVRNGDSLADLIRGWRDRALLTQEELAAKTGLGVRTIRRLETGEVRPRSASVRLLAEALELTGDERVVLRDAVVSRPAEPPAIRQLPADIAGFTGRAESLRALDDLLARTGGTSVVVSTIGGTAGVGKTALAIHWAHRVADRFPDGQFYLNLRGFDPGGAPVSAADAVRGLLDALGVPRAKRPAGTDAQAALYRSLLADHRVLVVLDNAHDAGQVRPLLPATPGSLVIVTSRDRLDGLVTGQAAAPLTLDALTENEAVRLLAARLGGDRVAREPEAVEAIVTHCAGLPLALAIVAARAALRPHFPLTALAAELRDARLDALSGDDPATDVRATLSWSYRRLSDPAARLLRLLGLFPGADIGEPAADSLAGSPTRAGLAELARANLVSEPSPGRYACHDLLQAYATELVHTYDPEDDRRTALRRLLDHYVHTAYAGALLQYPHRTPVPLVPRSPGAGVEDLGDAAGAQEWFTVEHRTVVALVSLASLSGFDEHAMRLAWTLPTYLERAGHFEDLLATQAAALAAAQRTGDQEWQARAYRGLGRATYLLSRFDEARGHYTSAQELCGILGDPLGQAHTLVNLANVCEAQGRLTDAVDAAVRSLDLYRVAGHRAGEADALNAIGWYHSLMTDHRPAVDYCRQALAIHDEIGNETGAANTWHSIGWAHHHLDEYEPAIDAYRQAADLYGRLGDRYFLGATLAHLGDAYEGAGDPRTARTVRLEALDVFDQIGHRDGGELRRRLERPDER